MSGAEPEDLDAVAGEYVLGVLDLPEMRGVRVRARHEPALAASIVAWEVRLAPLAEATPPQAPPSALWSRIEQHIIAFPEEAANDPVAPPIPPPAVVAVAAPQFASRRPERARSARGWQAATAAALALAAVFAGIAFLPARNAPGGAQLAAIAPVGAPQAAFVAAAQPDGRVVLTALAPAEVPPGRDLELWILRPGTKSVASLGVLPITGRTVVLPGSPATGTQLLVSLEPRGGSPTGQPTGPVLYAGTLTGI